MSKEETVEVTFKVPKRIIDFLEDVEYFEWDKNDIWLAAVKVFIDAELSNIDCDQERKLKEKHGDVAAWSYRIHKTLI